MRDKNWKCLRCGDCCRYIAGADEWEYTNLTEEQKATIEGQLNPDTRGCRALVQKEKLVCLPQYLFGLKPEACSDYSHRCGMTAKVKEFIDNRELQH